ncbi:MAG: threonine synthase [Candidatus Korarchaeota archaeon]|nr:threonine synthase [Candidatus Korarchaeota archaeon]NIU83845.1 threonine synthase [Candidatus Thorarchaeota archaeon]NIW13987.1 threonine synthase [Candidatus Thorarchaeota archaeon]NIW53603.1 threonine synthase [Candidatus Korarchaeota archaeon]
MTYLHTLECTKCKRQFSSEKPQTVCPTCNAPLYARYNLEKVSETLTKEDLVGRRADMWRYFELLPVRSKENIVSLGEGFTPILKLRSIAGELGMEELYLKDDGLNPTGTFKARGLAMAVSRAKELNLEKLAIPSAGNAAGALATYGANAGVEVYIVMPVDAPMTCKIESYMAGAHVFLVDGLISKCGEIIAEGTDRFGWFSVSTTKEPYRIEGKKTMGLEIAEYFNWTLPDVILYPTGGGTGLLGMWKAFSELQELDWIKGSLPRMVSVQSEGCAPIVKAYNEGRKESTFWEDAQTFADGIRVPKAFADSLILKTLYESDGGAVAVSDAKILSSSKTLAKAGVFACPEGAATLAGLTKLLDAGVIAKDASVLLYNTGTGLKYTNGYAEQVELDLPLIESARDISL